MAEVQTGTESRVGQRRQSTPVHAPSTGCRHHSSCTTGRSPTAHARPPPRVALPQDAPRTHLHALSVDSVASILSMDGTTPCSSTCGSTTTAGQQLPPTSPAPTAAAPCLLPSPRPPPPQVCMAPSPVRLPTHLFCLCCHDLLFLLKRLYCVLNRRARHGGGAFWAGAAGSGVGRRCRSPRLRAFRLWPALCPAPGAWLPGQSCGSGWVGTLVAEVLGKLCVSAGVSEGCVRVEGGSGWSG